MNNHSGITKSIWMATCAVPTFPHLRTNEEAEVCIVGAGIAGLTTACLLARAGHSVLVLDDGPIGSGETERTTAHLSTALDDRYYILERLHGREGARLAAESHGAAIDLIERLVREEGIDCNFSRLDGYLFRAPGTSPDMLGIERDAARRAGLADVEWADRAPLGSAYDTGPALCFPNQAQFHPLPYLSALARAFVRDGGRLRTHTHATRIQGGEHARVETAKGLSIKARHVVVATNTPVNDVLVMHTKQAAYRTYVLGLAAPGGSVPKSLFWDTGDPYHYARIQPAHPYAGTRSDILIVGGEDHKTGQADDAEARFSRLEDWTRELFPMAGEILYRWSGQIMEPVDGLGFIGRNPSDHRNVYIVTGDSGNGMTHGTIAGLLLKDLIEERGNPWASLYDPGRLSIRASGEYAHENLNAAAQYSGWANGGDVKDESQIAPDSGAVVRHGLSKNAVYCNDKHECHACSAVCTHLKGIVAWNSLEKSFDCPAHGSRFDRYGEVTNGPAIRNLKKAPQRATAGSVK